jgi:hypothetical protein
MVNAIYEHLQQAVLLMCNLCPTVLSDCQHLLAHSVHSAPLLLPHTAPVYAREHV